MDKQQTMDKAYELAFAYEQERGNCAQCTLAALQDTIGGIDDDLFQAASALAGGAAKTGQGTCGALAGGILAIGTRYGRDRAHFYREHTTRANELAKILFDKFVEEFGSPICAGVQETIFGRSFNLWDPDEFEAFGQAGGHTDKCPEVAGKTAMWTAEIQLDAESTAK